MVKHNREEQGLILSIANVQVPRGWKIMPDTEKIHEAEEAGWIRENVKQLISSKEETSATDDLTGMRLEAGKVVEARAGEIEYVRRKPV